MRTVIRLWFLLSAFVVGAQDSALVDTNGVLVHPTNFLSANGIAPLASPALSGNPTAPTATAGDNDTSISTTAFVTAAIEALKALQLWQDTNAVLTRLAGIGAGVSGDLIYRDATGWTNRASGTAAFSAATDFQATNANLTTIAGLTGGNASNFFRGTGAFAQVTSNDIPNLVTMLGGLQPLDADLTSIAGLTWTDTNTFLRGDKTLSRDGKNLTNLTATQLLLGTAPTNVLPGILSSLSVGNGAGVLTNLAFPQTYWFTNQNTTTNWTIPPGSKELLIEAIGSGGPGGSGRRGAAGSVRSGGSGGGGGSYSILRISNVQALWTNVLAIFIPTIATGGPSVTTDDSNGTNGTAANGSVAVYLHSVNTSNLLVRAGAGGVGIGGDADGSTGGAAGASSTFVGGTGGASSTTGLLGASGAGVGGGSVIGLGGAGGGAGGGITTGDVPSSGGSGGVGPLTHFQSITASPGGAPGVDGTNSPVGVFFLSLTNTAHGWFGAGGGGSQTNAPAGHGADGYGWGSGGGGGGASLNGYASGRGGNGGPAAVCITAY